jgi:hypothetical protein
MTRLAPRRLLLGGFLLSAAVCLGGTASAQAAKVKVFHHHAASHYDKARLKDVVVSSEGTLRLARQLRPLADLDATHVWDVIEDGVGHLFVATGDEAKVFKVAPDGKVSVAFASTEVSQVLCLARAPDGSVYAGTGPQGHIVRIDPKGEAKVIYESPESYVWALAVDPAGKAIYAATGPKGRIYRLTPEGKAEVFYTTRQEHVLCLAMGADGTLYAGTDKAGLVYRIDPKGRGFVLFSAPQAEVRRIVVAADAVYVGTSAPTRRRAPAGTAAAADMTPTPFARITSTPAAVGKPGQAVAAESNAATGTTDKESARPAPAPAPPPPANGENSVYRIAADGTVREVFREKVLMLALLRENGRFLVGTGMEGQLFEITETSREYSQIARLDHGQILALCRRQDGSVVLGTGDPGKLYVLQDRYVARGTVVSEVLDAKLISRWGALRWRADVPPGTSVTVAVRSGNVAEPDETWSDWSAEQTDPEQAVIAAPPARFLQYRVTLTSASPSLTPAFHGLTLRYLTTNQAPEVTAIEVPDLDAVNLENPKKLKVKWTATDANEDELTYRLYIRKDGWENWVLLEEDLEKKEYEWDTTTAPSGVYRLKVVASDRRDNPAEEALTGERISEPFVVSHTPPEVRLKVVRIEADGTALLEATASAPLARLTSAAFAVNGKKWVNVFPTDGLFDSKRETFRFQTEALKPGAYVLVLRVKDAAGNTGSGDVVFTVPAETAK